MPFPRQSITIYKPDHNFIRPQKYLIPKYPGYIYAESVSDLMDSSQTHKISRWLVLGFRAAFK